MICKDYLGSIIYFISEKCHEKFKKLYIFSQLNEQKCMNLMNKNATYPGHVISENECTGHKM